jgi:hypothetical protein
MGLVVGTFFALQALRRHWAKGWLPTNVGGRLLLSGFIVFGLTATREAVDVANGQPLVKAFTDYASWLIGLGLGIWATYRLIWLTWEDL